MGLTSLKIGPQSPANYIFCILGFFIYTYYTQREKGTKSEEEEGKERKGKKGRKSESEGKGEPVALRQE